MPVNDFQPDIVVTAKSLGAGTPISAITGRAKVIEAAIRVIAGA